MTGKIVLSEASLARDQFVLGVLGALWDEGIREIGPIVYGMSNRSQPVEDNVFYRLMVQFYGECRGADFPERLRFSPQSMARSLLTISQKRYVSIDKQDLGTRDVISRRIIDQSFQEVITLRERLADVEVPKADKKAFAVIAASIATRTWCHRDRFRQALYPTAPRA